jgi:hypothetical protein
MPSLEFMSAADSRLFARDPTYKSHLHLNINLEIDRLD